jgi:predicted NAD/FAD-binding protein
MFAVDPAVSGPNAKEKDAKPSLAVVGAGLAGLSAAWLLKDKYNVTLFELHEKAGMGVFTSDYHSNGISTRIDIPLRIFTKGYYPQLFSLYKYLDLEMEESDHSSVYQTLDRKTGAVTPFFQYSHFKLLGRSVNYLSRISLNIASLKLAAAQLSFFKKIKKDQVELKDNLKLITFKTYLSINRFNNDFINTLLLPALSVTCTCDYEGILEYPADLILEYLTCGVMDDGIVRAKQGVDGIIPKITSGYQVLCNEEVLGVMSLDGGASKLTSLNRMSGNISDYEFDNIVIATQANIAQKILANGCDADSIQFKQSDLLSAIPMQTSSMILHTDTDIVYNQQQAAPVSYIVDQSLPRPSTSVDLTKAFSTYQFQQPVFQTWNAIKTPKPEHIISEQYFTRPLVSLKSRDAVLQLQLLNQQSDIKICGSFMADKIPLLDAAVESSVEIARQLGVSIPWHNEHEAKMASAMNEKS